MALEEPIRECPRCNRRGTIEDFTSLTKRGLLTLYCIYCREQKRGKYESTREAKDKRNEKRRWRYANEPAFRIKCEERRLRDKHRDPIHHFCLSTLRHHRKRGIETVITLGEAEQLCRRNMDCSICGNKLDWSCGKPNRRTPSIDRINNEKIMTSDNVQMCCWECNVKKGNMTMVEFIDYCRLVIERHTQK